jgi:hypothetical protein
MRNSRIHFLRSYLLEKNISSLIEGVEKAFPPEATTHFTILIYLVDSNIYNPKMLQNSNYLKRKL